MVWPSPQDYNEAVQTPAASFSDPELQTAIPQTDHLGLPRPMTGHFASVYRMHCSGRDVALRCFLQEVPDQQKRYLEISRFVSTDDLPYTVGFDYIEKGIRIHGNWYPVLKMDWVEGLPLNEYIERNLSAPEKLSELADKFEIMLTDMRNAGIAHGDLQHGNILVIDDEIRLVDYDGMYVPSLKGLPANELGHRNYQHPGRKREHFGPYLDNFPGWIILNSLRTLSSRPALWTQLDGGDERILLSSADLQAPQRSRRITALKTQSDVTIVTATQQIRKLLLVPVEDVPPPGTELRVDDLPEEPDLPEWLDDIEKPEASVFQQDWTMPEGPVSEEKPDQWSSLFMSKHLRKTIPDGLRSSLNSQIRMGVLAVLAIPLVAGPLGFAAGIPLVVLALSHQARKYQRWASVLKVQPLKCNITIRPKQTGFDYNYDLFLPHGPALRLEVEGTPLNIKPTAHSPCLLYQAPAIGKAAIQLPDGTYLWVKESLQYLTMADVSPDYLKKMPIHAKFWKLLVGEAIGMLFAFSIVMGFLLPFILVAPWVLLATLAVLGFFVWRMRERVEAYKRWSFLLRHGRPQTYDVTVSVHDLAALSGESFKPVRYYLTINDGGHKVRVNVEKKFMMIKEEFRWPCVVYRDPGCREILVELPAEGLVRATWPKKT